MDVRNLYLQALHNGRLERGWEQPSSLDAAQDRCGPWLRLLAPTRSWSPDLLFRIPFSERVESIALPPADAQESQREWLAVGCRDGTIHIRDLRTGAAIRGHPCGPALLWPAHLGAVLALAWAADGRLVSGGADGSLVVWEVTGNDPQPVWRAHHEEAVTGLAWHPDGRLASGSRDHRLIAWSPATGTEPFWHGRGHEDWVNAVAWHSGGRLASAGADGRLSVWDPDHGGEARWTGEDHSSFLTSVAWHPDGRLVAGSDLGVAVWDPNRSTTPVWRVLDPDGAVVSVAWVDDNRVAAAGSDGSVKLWTFDADEAPCWIGRAHEATVVALARHPDGRLISGSHDHSVAVWDRERAGHPAPPSRDRDAWQHTPPGHRERQAITPGFTRVTRRFNAPGDTEIVWHSSERPDAIACATWDSDGHLATGSTDGSIALWPSVPGEEPVWRTQGHDQAVHALICSSGRTFASIGKEGALVVWDPDQLERPLWRLRARSGVRCATWQPDEGLVTGHADGLLAVWPFHRRGRELWRGQQGHQVLSVAWHPDGSLAVGDGNGGVTVWEPGRGRKPRRDLGGHETAVITVAWHTDGRLASCDEAGTVSLWRPGESEQPAWSASVRGRTLAWSPDGRWLSVGTTDRQLWVLDSVRGVPSAVYGTHSRILALRWTTDSREISVADGGASTGRLAVHRLALDAR